VPTVIAAPPTLSPGKLALVYDMSGVPHQASVNFIDGVNVNDITTIAADAQTLAGFVGAVLPDTCNITGFKVLSPEGLTLYAAALSSNVVGTHTTNPGMPEYASPTIKIMGHGAPVSLFSGSGHCSLMLFTSNAYTLVPNSKQLNAFDGPLLALMGHLNSNLRYWADFYGQHADTTGKVFVQFNAHEQKRTGS
jgi:hypothetical protein